MRQIRIFVSSPGDCAQERALLDEAVDRINRSEMDRSGILLRTFKWEDDVVPCLGPPPGDVVDEQTPLCDIYIGIMSARFGGDSSRGSGTEQEFRQALTRFGDSGAPWILFYFNDHPHTPQTIDAAQDFVRVLTFRKELETKGIVGTYAGTRGSAKGFFETIDLHLRTLLQRPELSGVTLRVPDSVPAPPSSWTGSPFPGLRALTPVDAPIFFGRRRETDTLVAKLCDSGCRFLLVAGASGSGKSSLVAAGLIPRLAAGAVSGSEDWLLPDVRRVGQGHAWIGLRFTPGEQGPNPFQALAAKLAPMLPDGASPRNVASTLEREPDRLVRLIDAALAGRPPRAEALLFVDQFEELITTVSDIGLQKQFVDTLVSAAESPRIRIVCTVRSDFWHRCIEAQPALADLLREWGFTVPLAVPGHSALTEIIDGPARRAGLRFDDYLVDDLAEETISRPGGLALLAFALHELYETRGPDGLLSRTTYERFGGLIGVIKQRADATFQKLPEAGQKQLGRVFARLVLVDESVVATRRRARRDEVLGLSQEAAEFVNAFEKERLLVSDFAGGVSVVEVAHEALLREWPLLSQWIQERAGDLRLIQQTEAAALEWHRHGRKSIYLWPHERLVPVYQSLTRLERRREDLGDPLRSFVREEWEWLLDELQQPTTTHQRRVAIGDRLDRLGDSRPGIGLREDGTPDIVWCKIPGGSIKFKGDSQSFDVAPFFIAKYAVTYRQYKAFVDAPDGYRNGNHWKDLEREEEPGKQYQVSDNHPADSVSWYEAVAFCRWLSGRLGYEVRLPSEREWQQAATGGDPRNDYPWGTWDSAHANVVDSRLGRTTAVGMYPRGASAQGVLDLAGNVSEWCRNFTPKNLAYPKGRGVLRGGSWSLNQFFARAADRNFYAPSNRYNDVGFRVVCVSPIS